MANPTGLAWGKSFLKTAATTLAHGLTAKKTRAAAIFHLPTRTLVTLWRLKRWRTVTLNFIIQWALKFGGIMYGGRDYKAYVPVQQSFSWEHGIIAYGASLETETTFATVGKEGVPEINMMSIQDFISIPLGKNVHNNLDFGRKLKKQPIIFGVNYFLKEVGNGKYLNGTQDKHVWIKWMELRVHNEVDALETPTGFIPKYEDLQKLFKQVLDKNYSKEDYVKQFTIRVPENLAKIERVSRFYQENVTDTPLELFGILYLQRQRLLEAKEKYGDYISPENFEKEKPK